MLKLLEEQDRTARSVLGDHQTHQTDQTHWPTATRSTETYFSWLWKAYRRDGRMFVNLSLKLHNCKIVAIVVVIVKSTFWGSQ